MLDIFWTCRAVITGQGLHEAGGAHRASPTITEGELTAAIAKGIAEQHRVRPDDVIVLDLAYSTAGR